MEKVIDKAKLDEAIRLNKKYFRTGDMDICREMHRAESEAFKKDSYWMSDILSGLTLKDHNYAEPYATYYKVFEALGYEIKEERRENNVQESNS